MKQDIMNTNISKEEFEFVQYGSKISDTKLETKPIGYLKDAMIRFRKNKASVVAAFIILILILFAAFGPLISSYSVEYKDMYMTSVLPKSKVFGWLGWDGCKVVDINESDYYYYMSMGAETGENPIVKVYGDFYRETKQGSLVLKKHFYKVRLDSYKQAGCYYFTLTEQQYKDLQAFQDANNVQIIYPALPVNNSGSATVDQYNANNWYGKEEFGQNKNLPLGFNSATGEVEWQTLYSTYTGTDGYTSKMRIEGEGVYDYNYSVKKQGGQYYVRLNYYRYYQYLNNGLEPSFLFGTNQYGSDIFVRLSAGARFSFLLAIFVSAINLTIGAIYGAIEGYYGGATDMIMERVSDVLSGVPFMVVVTLFQLHLAAKVGVVACLLFAFVTTGWIGMASRVRTQFYRFKGQEYVLAARTLGAKDSRLMFKHIFPNSLGTIITGSILVIPGVIFSESTLSYLGIINLDSSSITSVGTLLANGQGQMQNYPHIIFFPALFISLLMISFNLFGNGLRDAFNPSLRGVEE